MTRRSGWLAALAIAGFLSSACHQQNTQVAKQEDMKLLSVIEAALRDTWLRRQIEESADGPMLHVPGIREIFRSPVQYVASARAVIANPSASADAKRVAVLVMQCLSIDEYLDFLRFVFERVRESQCPDSALAKAIFPGEDWGFVIAENYQQEGVRELLLEIEESGVGGEAMREKIEAILDGRTAEYLEHLRKSGVRIPAIGCAEASRAVE